VNYEVDGVLVPGMVRLVLDATLQKQ
jgi:hypothetical protein